MFIRRRFFLRNGEPTAGTPPNSPVPNPVPTSNEVPEPKAPPTVAQIVVTGTKSERELQLESAVEREAARAKRAEIEAAALADENHRLKSVGLTTTATPAPKVAKPSFGWWPEQE